MELLGLVGSEIMIGQCIQERLVTLNLLQQYLYFCRCGSRLLPKRF